MEEERNQGQSVVSGEEGREVEVKDRGLFDFMGKKEEKEKEKEKEKSEEEADLVAGMEKVRVDEVEDTKEEEKKKEGFLEKLHRSHSSSSSSSSSSDEEGGGGEGSENKEKKKKKKGLKEKLEHKEEEKGEEEEEEEKEPVLVVAQEEFVEAVPAYDDDTAVTVEVVEGTAKVDGAPEGGEKKGFLEKIKEKLPGHKKPGEEPAAAAAAAPAVETAADECAKESNDHTAADAHEGKENKKGFLGKIMEKLPGYGKGGEEKEREPEKTSACN